MCTCGHTCMYVWCMCICMYIMKPSYIMYSELWHFYLRSIGDFVDTTTFSRNDAATALVSASTFWNSQAHFNFFGIGFVDDLICFTAASWSVVGSSMVSMKENAPKDRNESGSVGGAREEEEEEEEEEDIATCTTRGWTYTVEVVHSGRSRSNNNWSSMLMLRTKEEREIEADPPIIEFRMPSPHISMQLPALFVEKRGISPLTQIYQFVVHLSAIYIWPRGWKWPTFQTVSPNHAC